jgi:hypothetical protein
MSAPVRFGHCPCGAAISLDAAMCLRCEMGCCRVLHAVAQQTRRDQRSWDRRHDAAMRLYLLSIGLVVVMVAPTLEYQPWPNGVMSIGITLLVAGLGALIHPRDRRPR